MKHITVLMYNAMKKRILIILPVILLLSALYLNRNIIFQRGNPIPYLTAALRITETRTFVPVDNSGTVYISKRGPCPELFALFEAATGTAFKEQAGSGYLFYDGIHTHVITSEIYWGRFTVWTLSDPME